MAQPKLLLEMWIRCNTARSGSKFLQALRSQSPPALPSRQVLPGTGTKAEGPKCVFQLSSTMFLVFIISYIVRYIQS